MKTLRLTGLLAAAALCLCSGTASAGEQVYGKWQSNKKSYSWCTYTFQTSPDKPATTHVAVFYPGDKKHYYYWNPRTKQFWGRALVDPKTGCVTQEYQMLAPCDRKDDIDKIDPNAFPPATKSPKLENINPGVPTPDGTVSTVPVSSDRLVLPPDKPPEAFRQVQG